MCVCVCARVHISGNTSRDRSTSIHARKLRDKHLVAHAIDFSVRLRDRRRERLPDGYNESRSYALRSHAVRLLLPPLRSLLRVSPKWLHHHVMLIKRFCITRLPHSASSKVPFAHSRRRERRDREFYGHFSFNRYISRRFFYFSQRTKSLEIESTQKYIRLVYLEISIFQV